MKIGPLFPFARLKGLMDALVSEKLGIDFVPVFSWSVTVPSLLPRKRSRSPSPSISLNVMSESFVSILSKA